MLKGCYVHTLIDTVNGGCAGCRSLSCMFVRPPLGPVLFKLVSVLQEVGSKGKEAKQKTRFFK